MVKYSHIGRFYGDSTPTFCLCYDAKQTHWDLWHIPKASYIDMEMLGYWCQQKSWCGSTNILEYILQDYTSVIYHKSSIWAPWFNQFHGPKSPSFKLREGWNRDSITVGSINLDGYVDQGSIQDLGCIQVNTVYVPWLDNIKNNCFGITSEPLLNMTILHRICFPNVVMTQ